MRDAADRLECRDMAAQNRLHVLVQDKPRPNQPAEAEHKGEQPDDAGDRRFISEPHLELSKVDLGLVARRRLEADFKGLQWARTNLAQHIRDGGVAALVAAFAQLPQEPPTGQPGISRHPLA